MKEKYGSNHKELRGFCRTNSIKRATMIMLALMATIGLIKSNVQLLSNIYSHERKVATQEYSADAGPRGLRTHTYNTAIGRYPFTNLADVISPRQDEDTAFYWQIPRSGGTTLKHILGKCIRVTQASRTSLDYCDVESKELHVCQTNFGPYVNADTSDDHGIQRAREMELIKSGLVDVVVSSRFLHASALFDAKHMGRAFTVLRDPMERAVSTFYYLKEADWERTHKEFYKDMSLLQYIQLEETASDWMVRWLTGKQSESILTKSDLNLAKEILKKKFLILLTEEMSISVERLIRFMGWKVNPTAQKCIEENVAKVSRHNKSIHPNIKLGTKEYDALKAKNKLDIELYDYALELFREQWASVSSLQPNSQNQ